MSSVLRQKIKNGEKTVGMYIQLTDVSIARIAGLVGYDFVWVDTEHSYMTTETLIAHIMTLKSTGTPVIVRVPQDDLTFTKRILEMGVDGIIFPMVRTAAEAERLVATTLYPPYGTRGFGPMSAVDYGLSSVKDYIAGTREELCRFIQIEDQSIIDELDEVMQNEYIDGYMFGPNDLSASHGLLGRPFEEEITLLIKQTVERLHEKGKYVGIASGGWSEEVVAHWSSLGADMLVAGADFDFIRDGAIKNRRTLGRIHKGETE